MILRIASKQVNSGCSIKKWRQLETLTSLLKIIVEHCPGDSRLVGGDQVTCVPDKCEVKIGVVFGPAEVCEVIVVFPHGFFGISPLFGILPFQSVHVGQDSSSVDDEVVLPVINQGFDVKVEDSFELRLEGL